jgi:hypothetical protein
VIYATAWPRADNTSTNEAQRQSLDSLVTNTWTNGSFACDGVDDTANDPLVATQTVPNAFNPAGATSYNNAWYSDGTHPNAALNAEIASQESVATLAGQGRLSSCKTITKQIPYQVFTAANTASPSTTQTIPILQLGPGWQVCSLSTQVANAFVGTGITASTFAIGDSTGTTTQYLAATNLLTTGTTSSAPTFVSASGIVQLVLSATGGNLTAFTAGNLTVNIGVTLGPVLVAHTAPSLRGYAFYALNSSSQTTITTSAITVTAGDLLVAYTNATGNPTTISFSSSACTQGWTYAGGSTALPSAGQQFAFCIASASGSTTLVATFATASTFNNAILADFIPGTVYWPNVQALATGFTSGTTAAWGSVSTTTPTFNVFVSNFQTTISGTTASVGGNSATVTGSSSNAAAMAYYASPTILSAAGYSITNGAVNGQVHSMGVALNY